MPTIMKSYKYVAIDPSGKRVKGNIEATNRIMCTRFLENKNMQVLNVSEYKNVFTVLSMISFGQTIKVDVLVFYLKQLGALLTSGIKLSESLEILAMQQENKAVRRILFAVQQEVFNGNKLSSAFAIFPSDFPGLLVSMTEAGEVAGELGAAIVKTAEHFEKQSRLNRQITAAIRTPVLYFAGAIAVTIGMLIFVFPGITQMFSAFQAEDAMPLPTKFFMSLSDFFVAYWPHVLIPTVALIILFLIFKKFSLSFRKGLAYVILKTPFIGTLVQMSNQIMISNTLAQLMSRSVNTILALEVVKKVTKNYVYMDLIQETIDNISDGKKFSKSFEESWAIDSTMSRMIATGEKTSEIPKMLQNLSNFYNEVSEIKVARLRATIQPFLLIFVYALIGSLLLAIILPQLALGTAI